MNGNTNKMLALTFDDGPSETIMPQIMDLLIQYDARATFFVVGDNITDTTVPLLKAAVAQGFEIGNHSKSHLHMSQLTKIQITQEIMNVQQKVSQITGRAPVMFRPPYLDVNPLMLETIEMPLIGGNANNDWDPNYTVAERVELARRAACDGAILLMHCFEGNHATVEALRILLPELKQQNYALVTVSQLFAHRKISPKHGVLYNRAVP